MWITGRASRRLACGCADPALWLGAVDAGAAVSRWTRPRAMCSRAEAGEDKVEVFVPEEGAGAPVVDGVSAKVLRRSQRELGAQIDPRGAQSRIRLPVRHGGLRDESVVVYAGAGSGGRDRCGVRRSECERRRGWIWRRRRPTTTGCWRATRWAAVKACRSETFTTLPSAGVLPDGRAWEMVSPPNKHGAAIEVVSKSRGGSIQASLDGGAIAWLATAPVVSEPEGNRSLELTQLLSEPGSRGVEHGQSLETPHDQGSGLILPSPASITSSRRTSRRVCVQPTEPAGPGRKGVEHRSRPRSVAKRRPTCAAIRPRGDYILPLVTSGR